MSIVLVANTPHSAALIMPAIAQLHSNAGPIITIAASRTAFFFPEKTAYCDFPIIQNVEREPFLIGSGFAPRRKTTPIPVDEVVEELCQASKVYLFNPGPGGFRSHYHATLMVRFYNKDAEIRVIEDHPLHFDATINAIETAALIDDYQPILDTVAIDEHFDFNFRINNYPVITKLLERVGSKAWFNMSVGALQLLLWLRSREKGKGHSFSAKELEIKVKLWEGSGKFARVDSFGRRISLQTGFGCRAPLDDLRGMRLLNDEREQLELSSTGRFVADAYPSNCLDVDLPFRIEAWKRLPYAEATSEINSYLMNFLRFTHQSSGIVRAVNFSAERVHKMRIALICEKPSLAKMVIDELLFIEPDMDRSSFVIGWANEFYNLNSAFVIPRGQSYQSFPMTCEAVYRPMTFDGRYFDREGMMRTRRGISERSHPHFSSHDTLIDNDDFLSSVERADVVYVAFYANPSGYHVQMRVLDWLKSLKANFTVKHLPVMSIVSADLHHVLLNAREIDNLAEHAQLSVVRRHFDYNYLLNAYPIMGMTFEKAFGKRLAWPLSKHELQVLYFMRRHCAPLSDGKLFEVMSRWKGTGRYDTKGWDFYYGVGNPASRSNIMKNLESQGLLERTGNHLSFLLKVTVCYIFFILIAKTLIKFCAYILGLSCPSIWQRRRLSAT